MNKKFWALILGCAMLMSGCSLARESEVGEDRLVGVYAVCSRPGERIQQDENWIERGQAEAESDMGTIKLPHMILPGTYDAETGKLTFPGCEGYALVGIREGEGEDRCNSMASDMMDGSFHITVTDEGQINEMSGTIYVSESMEDAVWTMYHVYATPEGMYYLDGSGDSVGGSDFTSKVTGESALTCTGPDGKETIRKDTVKAEIHVEAIPEIRELTVYQYDGDGQLLKVQQLPVQEEIPPVIWETDSVWAAVKQVSDETVVTTCMRPQKGEESVSQRVYIPQKSDVAKAADIEFKEP